MKLLSNTGVFPIGNKARAFEVMPELLYSTDFKSWVQSLCEQHGVPFDFNPKDALVAENCRKVRALAKAKTLVDGVLLSRIPLGPIGATGERTLYQVLVAETTASDFENNLNTVVPSPETAAADQAGTACDIGNKGIGDNEGIQIGNKVVGEGRDEGLSDASGVRFAEGFGSKVVPSHLREPMRPSHTGKPRLVLGYEIGETLMVRGWKGGGMAGMADERDERDGPTEAKEAKRELSTRGLSVEVGDRVRVVFFAGNQGGKLAGAVLEAVR